MHSLLSSFGSSPAPVLAEIYGLGSISGIELGLIMGLAGMLFGGVMAVLGIKSETEKRRQRHELIRIALEKGQPLPPELLNESERATKPAGPRGPRNDRRSGIILLAISAGLFAFLYKLIGINLAYVAFIPGAIGLALLLIHFLDAGDGKKAERDSKPGASPDAP